ncbi:MAG: twin-arginine translocation signal domain-containing protein, partial [Candidatus Cryptobacteroides sp.]|nr:twin-arginine translocation signal domain-containing protein [Bacteroidales bacterium]MDY5494441.1 twin-arginine translocation signal domain-containing protein [Candidatus Cryptobacteroides sp.]
MDRRNFLKTAAAGSAAVAVGGSAVLEGCSAGNQGRKNVNGLSSRLRMSFEPYELQLRHVFTVSSYSRKTTPGVQVRID